MRVLVLAWLLAGAARADIPAAAFSEPEEAAPQRRPYLLESGLAALALGALFSRELSRRRA